MGELNVFITKEQTDSSLVFCLDGRFDTNTADIFKDTFAECFTESITSFTVDMEKVDFVSSAAVRALTTAYKQLPQGALHVINANKTVHDVFALQDLLTKFDVR